MHGHETYQIELTYPTGVQWEVFFDQQSHLIVAEKASMGSVPQEIDYDDYRVTNGVKVPYKVEIHRGSEMYVVNVTRAETNETIGERVFDFPMQSQVKLPRLEKTVRGNRRQPERDRQGQGKLRGYTG